MSNNVHIIYCTDTNYLMPTLVSAASALFHEKEHPVILHIIETGISDSQWNSFYEQLQKVKRGAVIIRHTWNDSRFDKFPAWHGSRIIYARLVVQELLGEFDWAISVDGDTLWLGDPWEMMKLHNENMVYQISDDPLPPDGSNNPVFEWFKERNLYLAPNNYFCVGAMIMNLRKLRNEFYTQKALDFLTKYPDPKLPEQMVMCYIAQGYTSPLPKQWGVFSVYHDEIDILQPCLIHFVQDAPWHRSKKSHLISDIVLIWHKFANNVLTMNVGFGINSMQYFMRRFIFLFLKSNQWIWYFFPKLKNRFRNTCGLTKEEFNHLYNRFNCHIK